MNQIYTHPGQDQMQVEVILASKGPDQKPIYTIRMRYPRIIHGEIMTHRVFSRNARSSRAVPVKTMLNEVRNTPFVPWHWGKNQEGMQADEECSEPVYITDFGGDVDFAGDYPRDALSNVEAWIASSQDLAMYAEAFMNAGYHKQIPNRLLEPFSWIDTLVTSTEWDNFLWLRDHKDAEPHLQDLARLVHQAIDNATIVPLEPDEWHQPYIVAEDWTEADRRGLIFDESREFINKISAARCARISYKPFDGDASYERELERYDSLVTADRVHASPLEHQATPDVMVTASVDLFQDDNESLTPDETLDSKRVYKQKQLHGNLDGYIQYRKTIPNEAKMEGVL